MREPPVGRSDSPKAGRKVIVSLVSLAIILSVDFYHHLSPYPILDDLLLYLVVPLLIILLIFRDNPLHYGLALGRWREGIAWTAGGMLLMVGVAWLFFQLPEFSSYYVDYYALRNPSGDQWLGVALSGLQMFAWEFLFRGFLLFALADLFGPYAVWIQTVPFAMAHFGKPEWETYSSIVGGALSGWIAYRVGSIYPSWLIHWALAVGVAWLLSGGA